MTTRNVRSSGIHLRLDVLSHVMGGHDGGCRSNKGHDDHDRDTKSQHEEPAPPAPADDLVYEDSIDATGPYAGELDASNLDRDALDHGVSLSDGGAQQDAFDDAARAIVPDYADLDAIDGGAAAWIDASVQETIGGHTGSEAESATSGVTPAFEDALTGSDR